MTYKTLVKLVFIILLTLIGDSKVFAQRKFIYHFDTSKTVQAPGFYDKVKVIDLRIDKSNVGQVQIRNAFSKNEKFDLVTEGSFEANFNRYVEHLLKQPGSLKKRELLLVVYGFRGENKPGIASFYIRFEAFAGLNEQYRMVISVDTLYEYKQDQVSNMQRLIDENLLSIMSDILLIDPEAGVGSNVYTLNEAKNRIAEDRKRYPVYYQSAKDGLYSSFDKFLQNDPESIGVKNMEKVIITESLTHYYVYVDADSRKGERRDAKDFFAVHHKDTWYVSDGRKFNVMTFENGDFYTEAKMKGTYSVRYRYTAVGGLVTVWTAPEKEEKAWGTYKARLDPEHGNFSPTKRIR